MDLGSCPRCGADWEGGERCTACGYVPIGAGLSALPKKKRKRRRYVEPGSSRGFLSFSLLGLLAYTAGTYQPWRDDWEMVNRLMGRGRYHDVKGDWVITKHVVMKGSQTLFAPRHVSQGRVQFKSEGVVRMRVRDPEGNIIANGKYDLQGTRMVLRALQAEGANVQLPQKADVRLVWNGPNKVLASFRGSDTLYLQRRGGDDLGNLLRFAVNPRATRQPGALRGLLGDSERRVSQD